MSDRNDIDELLAKAEGMKKSRRRCENHKGVIRYLDELKIEPGVKMVPTYAIFYHYKSLYDGVASENKAKKVTFFRTFSKRFPQYRKKRQRYYLVNEFFDFTPEILERAKKYDKQFGQKKKYQKKKAVQLPGQEGNNGDET